MAESKRGWLETWTTWVSAVGIPVTLLFTGYTLSEIPTMSSRLGAVETRLGAIDGRLDKIETRLDSLDKHTASLDARMLSKETDPLQLLAQMGVKTDGKFTAAMVANQVFVFPGSPEDEKVLMNAGFEEKKLSPFLTGWTYKAGLKEPNLNDLKGVQQ